MTEAQGPMESTHRYPPRQGVPGERPLVPETSETGVTKLPEPLFAEFRHPSVTPLGTQPSQAV